MGDNTGISWTDATWNPTRGCQVFSPGCANCYAMRQAGRMSGPEGAYEGLVKLTGSGFRWTGAGRLVSKMLDQPMRWTKPRRIFVDSMSDLFYEGFSDTDIAAVFGIMAACPQHTFQVLTKRAKRMREWFEWAQPNALRVCLDHASDALGSESRMLLDAGKAWPLPNVWLGVSVENQHRADERIPDLLATPAALRWVSVEPQLGPVDLSRWLGPASDGILWIVQGGESGPGARPFDLAWAESMRDQCNDYRVSYFLKQLGARPGHHKHTDAGRGMQFDYDGSTYIIRDRAGSDTNEWPAALRVQEFPR